MKNDKFEQRLAELTEQRDKLRSDLFSSSDATRETIGNVQSGLYLAQLAMGVFKTLTNYHMSPKKRVQKVVLSLAMIAAAKLIKEYILKKQAEEAYE